MDKKQTRNKTSEIDELKKDLSDSKKDKKIEAIKRIIGLLNVGKDVSSLFFGVVNCLAVDDLEIHKLVYLYIIHYSKDKPSDSLMAINSLVKDATNKSNPLVRALAIRTIGCLRVKDLCNYLMDPLKKALEDSDAYVRKNAVMCVPKVYEIDAQLVESHNLIQIMKNILEKDKNSVVLANTVTALSEINVLKPAASKIKILTKNNLENVLVALNETVGRKIVIRMGTNLHFGLLG